MTVRFLLFVLWLLNFKVLLHKNYFSISLKLTVFNKDGYSYIHMNFLRDQMSFNVDTNLYNID